MRFPASDEKRQPRVAWTGEIATGVEEIDAQHHRLHRQMKQELERLRIEHEVNRRRVTPETEPAVNSQ